MKYNSYIKPFRTLYARITMWIMLTVLVVFVIITYLVTYFGAKGVLLGSTENAKSRMEITNQRMNSVMQSVEVAVYNTIPEVELSLNKPDDMYRILRRLFEINPYIVGSTVAFEPYYYKEKGEQFSPYAYRGIGGTIYTKQLGTADYEYHYMDWYLIPKLLKKNYWSEPYYDHGGGEQMMTTFSHPLYDKKGTLYAIITADISLEWVTELLRKSDIEFNQKALELDVDNEDEIQAEMENDSTFFYNHAFVHKDNAAGDLAGEGHFVGYDYHGSAFGGELSDYVQNFTGEFWVEGGSWFIKKNYVRIYCDGTGNTDSLLLTARKS